MDRIKINCLCLILLFCLVPVESALPQIRSGMAFLKIPPGSSIQTVRGGFSALIDGSTAQFANPGTIGFYRQWQLSTNFTHWIADVHQASLNYGFGLQTPWSRNTKVGLALLYQGVPEFDSSNLNATAASASEVIAALGIGQPLSLISSNISLGINLKYFRSDLAQYSAAAWIFDFGVLGHTPKFRTGLPVLEYTYLSAGLALTQFGNPMSYDQLKTPLPLTWRAGLALYLGTHRGIKIQLMSDFYKIKDEADAVSFGTEISFSNLLALNAGFAPNDLVAPFFLGAKLNLNDFQFSKFQWLPGRNQALELDLVSLHENDFFGRTYHGGIIWGPNGPRNFSLIRPARNDTVRTTPVVLRWETTTDPDLYDDLKYTVVVDADSGKIADLIDSFEQNRFVFWTLILPNLNYQKVETTNADSLEMTGLTGGRHYWTVFASDLDDHFVFARRGDSEISSFIIPTPNVKIKQIIFDYSPWITEDDYQGDLNILIENSGNVAVNDLQIQINDSLLQLVHTLPGFRKNQSTKNLILGEEKINQLAPGEMKVIKIPWRATGLGKHKIEARLNLSTAEQTEQGDVLAAHFYTIPKGKFTCPDTTDVLRTAEITFDMPVITEICFQPGSATILPEYLDHAVIDPPIRILSTRLKANPQFKIQLQGFADANSDENNVDLANQRANAVKEAMVQQGVPGTQIEILPGEILAQRRVPKDEHDARWVFEERRFVKISADKGRQVLFEPVRHNDPHNAVQPVQFENTVKSVLVLASQTILSENKKMNDSVSVRDSRSNNNSQPTLEWRFDEQNAKLWVGDLAKFSLAVVDSLGRRFRTPGKMTYLQENLKQKEHRLAFPLKFGQTEPLYPFFWERLFDQCRDILENQEMRFVFHGHACAIGPSEINDKLSRQRADFFEKQFRAYIKSQHPEYLQKISERLDPACGFGESNPLKLQKMESEPILVGDNENPLGRKLNRRIEITFYPKK